MTKIQFSLSLEQPKDGWTVIFFDGKVYENRGDYFYECGGKSCLNKPYSEISSGTIYHFPNPFDILAILKNRGCLDKFLFTPKQEDIEKSILEKLKSGKIIGFVSPSGIHKYRARHTSNILFWEDTNHPNWQKNNPIQSVKEQTWYEFENEMELYKWILEK